MRLLPFDLSRTAAIASLSSRVRRKLKVRALSTRCSVTPSRAPEMRIKNQHDSYRDIGPGGGSDQPVEPTCPQVSWMNVRLASWFDTLRRSPCVRGSNGSNRYRDNKSIGMSMFEDRWCRISHLRWRGAKGRGFMGGQVQTYCCVCV